MKESERDGPFEETIPRFTANWFPSIIFDQYLGGLKGKEGLLFLEIGLLEGQGTTFFFEKFLGATGTMVGIDPFIEYSKATVAKIEGFDHIINESLLERFLSNTKPFADRITFYKGLSQNVLPSLETEIFDMVFIDGDHSRDAVAIDARESLRLVKKGGYIVFDDYVWGYKECPEMSPKDAIDKFLEEHKDEIEIVHKAWCVVVKKLTD